MILPVSNDCRSSSSCDVVTYAPFLIMDGTNPVNNAWVPQSGWNGNCHIGQLLPAGMIDGEVGTGVLDTGNPGLFAVQLSCDPVDSGCGL